MEIMGQKLNKAFEDLGIPAVLVLETPDTDLREPFQVWEVPNEHINRLFSIKPDEWKDDHGWYRSGGCIYQGSANTTYQVNNQEMQGYASENEYQEEDGDIWFVTEYGNFVDYLEGALGLTAHYNIAMFAESLAIDNGMKLSDFLQRFQGHTPTEEVSKEYTKSDCRVDTADHILEVNRNLHKFVNELDFRGSVHDQSKLESPELEIFTEYTPKLRESTYGSQQYHENLKGMSVALEHHYEHNSHHPEHYPDGIRGMDLLDIVEMFCDWKAATQRHANGDLNKSIELNQSRFGYSDDLLQIFKNSVRILE